VILLGGQGGGRSGGEEFSQQPVSMPRAAARPRSLRLRRMK